MNFEVALIYRVNDGDVIIARTLDDDVVKTVKYTVLKEAAEEASMWKKIDADCYQLVLADFQRLVLLLGAQKINDLRGP